jgi:hypothetical protein
MKPKLILCLALVLIGVRLSTQFVAAQNYMGFDMTSLQPTGTNVVQRSFSAIGDLELQSGDIAAKISIGLTVDGGNVRTFIDFANGYGDLFQRGDVTALRQYGIDKMITIERPSLGKQWDIYPARRAYIEEYFQPGINDDKQPAKTFQGEETIDGHPCRKYRLDFPKLNADALDYLFKDLSGLTMSGTEWDATDLENFPVQIELGLDTKTDHVKIRLHYRDIKLGKCDPALFELPTNYMRFESMDEMFSGYSSAQAKATKADMDARVLKSQQELADQGDRYGEYRMGLRYRDGDGVPQDLIKARELLQESADQGYTAAATELAKLFPKTKLKPSPSETADAKILSPTNLTILSAEFGMGKQVTNVTARVIELLQTRPGGFTADANSFRADPLPGKKKRLVVRYDYKGDTFTLTIPAAKQMSYQALVKNASK